MLAKQAAVSLEAYVNERIKAMEVLADLPSMRRSEQKNFQREYQRTFHKIKGFQHIIYVDTAGVAQIGYPSDFPCPSKQPAEIHVQFLHTFKHAAQTHRTMIFSKDVLVENDVFICLISPIFTNQNKFSGAIVGVLNVRESLNSALTPIVGSELNFGHSHVFLAEIHFTKKRWMPDLSIWA
jgi:sensor domain CHASE-containing protein